MKSVGTKTIRRIERLRAIVMALRMEEQRVAKQAEKYLDIRFETSNYGYLQDYLFNGIGTAESALLKSGFMIRETQRDCLAQLRTKGAKRGQRKKNRRKMAEAAAA